ncbi:MAG: GreA/GreB family elongation factor [Verrucomicrobiota bacterium]
MSKAFTRESDDGEDRSIRLPTASTLPPGAKNYLTQRGADDLAQRLARLREVDRPALASGRDDPDTKRQLRVLDARMAQIESSLQTAVIVAKPSLPDGQVRFGATVTVRDRGAEVTRYRIVGVDEVDLERNWISWTSPIAKALLNAVIGAKVHYRKPSGAEELEILAIEYE